jgi:hypothetical protein
MTETRISIRDVAAELGTRKQAVFKVMKRLGIAATQSRDPSRGNQLVGYVTRAEFQRIGNAFNRRGDSEAHDLGTAGNADGFISSEIGVFYLVQLEPELDPCRFKVGFAANLQERLRALRCSAPFAKVIETWPCRRLWERTAIDCVTDGGEQLHTEVFRTTCLEQTTERCRRFFGMMPCVDRADQS